MGTPKALLPWGNSTLLGFAIELAHKGGVDDLVVVLGPATQHLQVNAVSVVNRDPGSGRSASIRLGCEALPDDVAAVVVQSVDQPVEAEVLSALFEAIGGSVDVAIPTYHGRRGHPVSFAGRLLAELRQVSEQDQGLRAVVRRYADSVADVPVDKESILWNLNDPAAYAAARLLKP
jgi:molybdenum cofactor cytidylyltransferase